MEETKKSIAELFKIAGDGIHNLAQAVIQSRAAIEAFSAHVEMHGIYERLGRNTGLGQDAVAKYCQEKSVETPFTELEIARMWEAHFNVYGRLVDFRRQPDLPNDAYAETEAETP